MITKADIDFIDLLTVQVRMKDFQQLGIPIRVNPYPLAIRSMGKFLEVKKLIIKYCPYVVAVEPVLNGHILSSDPPIELLITFMY